MRTSTEILMQEIYRTILKIQKEYPERYELLSEMPLIISYDVDNINDESYRQYLESLQIIINKNN
jgi:hypothetical protein